MIHLSRNSASIFAAMGIKILWIMALIKALSVREGHFSVQNLEEWEDKEGGWK